MKPHVSDLEQLTEKLSGRAGMKRQNSLHMDLGDVLKRLDNLDSQTADKIKDLESKNQKWTEFYQQMAVVADNLSAKENSLPKADSNLLPEERYKAIMVSNSGLSSSCSY